VKFLTNRLVNFHDSIEIEGLQFLATAGSLALPLHFAFYKTRFVHNDFIEI